MLWLRLIPSCVNCVSNVGSRPTRARAAGQGFVTARLRSRALLEPRREASRVGAVCGETGPSCQEAWRWRGDLLLRGFLANPCRSRQVQGSRRRIQWRDADLANADCWVACRRLTPAIRGRRVERLVSGNRGGSRSYVGDHDLCPSHRPGSSCAVDPLANTGRPPSARSKNVVLGVRHEHADGRVVS